MVRLNWCPFDRFYPDLMRRRAWPQLDVDLASGSLGTSSKLWMNFQATWDLDVETKRRHRAA
ncbi:MAG: hypothetical protein ACM3H9_06500 [Rhodospirillaceae bacterium]